MDILHFLIKISLNFKDLSVRNVKKITRSALYLRYNLKNFRLGAVVYTLNIQKIACDSNSYAKYEKITCGTELSIV